MSPDFSSNFPARRLITALTKKDLVLPRQTLDQIAGIETWIKTEEAMAKDWGVKRRLKSGCSALFHGPPGSGKSLAAAKLGQTTGREVYKVDLSMLVSKYIGETEKNLSRIIDEAEQQGWILFFNEADALFGKRTDASSANDRYANQEVSYLMQRIEACSTLTILATNLRRNIDEAFVRRFQFMVMFPGPNKDKHFGPVRV